MTKKESILIVEDERIVALDLKMKLERLGYKVAGIKSSGQQAIKFCEENYPDLVLMDIMIKGEMDGIATAQILKNEYRIPFIYLSALSDESTIQRAKLTEPYGFILKPYEVGEVKTNIEIALYKSVIEKKLFESELKYRTLFVTAQDAVITMDEQGVITSANKKASELFGFYEETALESILIKEIIPDIFVNHLAEGVKRFINTGKPVLGDTLELRGKKNDGMFFPMELSFSQWVTRDKHQFTLILRDITQRKEQEMFLKNSKMMLEKEVARRTKELSALIEQSSFPITVYDLNGKIININKAMFDIWPLVYGNTDYAKYNLFEDQQLKHYKLAKKVIDLYNKTGLIKSQPIYFEQENILNEDEGKILIFNYYSVKDEQQNVNNIVLIIEDITSTIKAEELSKIIHRQKEFTGQLIERIEEDRCRISRELHDEIGPILFAAKFNIEGYKKEFSVDNKYLNDAKEMITKAGIELKSIIYSMHPPVLDNYGLEAAIKILLTDLQNYGIIVENNSGLGNIRFSKFTELNLYRMIQEILTNIKKHSGCRKTSYTSRKTDDWLLVMIKDDGKGFETDYNANGKNSKCFGLKNIKERCELLNGIISIDSRVNCGTTIQIEIPVGENEKNKSITG